MAARKLGVIAEDKSDVAVLKILVERLHKAPIPVSYFVGHGCGKIIGKSEAWSAELARLGCKTLIVMHDLDSANRSQLLAKLEKATAQSPIAKRLILVPVKEIEAWLLSDEMAIEKFFKLKGRPKRIFNPEQVPNPKENLSRLVQKMTGGKKRYVNTIHNERLAKDVSLNRLRLCPSFAPLEAFVSASIR